MHRYWSHGILGAGLAALIATSGCAKKVAVIPPAVAQPQVVVPPETRPAPAQVAAAKPQAFERQATPAPKPQRISIEDLKTLEESLARLEDALFDYDQSTIRPDAAQALQKDVDVVREILNAYPQERLKIEGHADQRGSDEYNLALGDRRAEAARMFLTGMGVPSGQLSVVSFGKERPVCTDESEACYQKNRRAHLTVAD